MTKLLLSLHVLAAILAIGPVTVAASMFPRTLRGAHDDPAALATLRVLHRICRVYAGVGVALLVFGFATAGSLGVLGSPWLIASIVLTVVAAGVLLVLVLPGQEAALEAASAMTAASSAGTEMGTSAATDGSGTGPVPDLRAAAGRLAMSAGLFNLLWAVVTVLMIVRPGSTTGA